MKYIQRFPFYNGRMADKNIMTNWCIGCETLCTHGYRIYESYLMTQNIFICDECLKKSKKEAKG